MSRANRIRAWLATQAGPQTSAAMAAGIGDDVMKTQFTVGVMLRGGLLERVKDTRPMLYVLGREPIAREETWQRFDIGRKRWQAELRETAGRRKAERDAEIAARAKARQAKREAAQAAYNDARQKALQARMAAKRRQQIAAQQKALCAALARQQPKAPEQPAQTVEEWLAQGNAIQRLSIGEVSKPVLRYQYGVAA